MNNILLIVLVIIVLLAAVFIIPQWRLKRAIRQVIQILREHNAIDAKNAKTIDELGLRPRGMMEGMFRGRDYKQYALSTLMKGEIVKMTSDGRFYLSEDRLMASGIDRGSTFIRR